VGAACDNAARMYGHSGLLTQGYVVEIS